MDNFLATLIKTPPLTSRLIILLKKQWKKPWATFEK